MTSLRKAPVVAALLAALCAAVQGCGPPSEPGCRDWCDNLDLGAHELRVQVLVEYTTRAPVVGAEVTVVFEPPRGSLERPSELVDTTNDSGIAGGTLWSYSRTMGQAQLRVTVVPQPPFELPVVVRTDSILLDQSAQRRGRGRRIVIQYPPHRP